MNLVTKAILALALIWGLATAVMWAAHRAAPTPEKVAEFLASHPLDARPPGDRERIIRQAARQINQLDFEQRREARERRQENDPARQFFRGMTPAEQALFTELTIGPTFSHLMKALNEMTPEERAKVAQDALAQLRREGMQPPGEFAQWGERGEEIFEKVTAEGLRAYYEDGSADTKIDLAPVLEEMQQILQDPRRRWKHK